MASLNTPQGCQIPSINTPAATIRARKAPTRRSLAYAVKLLYRTGVYGYFETHRRGLILPMASIDRILTQRAGLIDYREQSHILLGEIKTFRNLTDSPP